MLNQVAIKSEILYIFLNLKQKIKEQYDLPLCKFLETFEHKHS